VTTEGLSGLHPTLKKRAAVYRRRVRLLGLLLFLLMAGALLFGMVGALTSQDLGSLLTLGLVGLVLLPSVALAGGLIWYVDRAATKELNSANQLLVNYAPRQVRLTPVASTARGQLVELRPPMAGPIYAAFQCQWFTRSLPPEGMEVQLYGRQFTRHSELIALQANGIPLFGKVVDRKAWQRGNQLFQLLLWVIVITNVIYWFAR